MESDSLSLSSSIFCTTVLSFSPESSVLMWMSVYFNELKDGGWLIQIGVEVFDCTFHDSLDNIPCDIGNGVFLKVDRFLCMEL